MRVGLIITLVCLPVLLFQARAADKPDPASSQDLPCKTPDDSLLHQGGFRGLTMPVNEKVEKYNKQVHAFNDCTRALIDKNYAEIDHIRADAMAAMRLVMDTANAQIADIRVKIRNAKSGAAAGYSSQPDITGMLFPAPECKAPDRSLLKLMRKDDKNFRPESVRNAEYGAQEKRNMSCIETYIGQASAEIRQIGDLANTQILGITVEANGRIESLKATAGEALSAAKAASADQEKAIAGAPIMLNGSPVNWHVDNNVESVTVEGQRLSKSLDTPNGKGDPDAIACRLPQQLPGYHLTGPEICKRNREWAALYKDGNDLSPDGKSIVPSEKARTLYKGRLACTTFKTGGEYSETITNEICQ
jgi:hypothetical protein